ncbi:MAG: PorV/PorQ family protein [Bacteroidota bacterium]
MRETGKPIRLAAALLLVFATMPHAVQAQPAVSKAGTTAADFLQIGVGPRAMAMGGAFVAQANDASALYWNPAGLANLPNGEVIVAHSSWLADVTFGYAGVALPTGRFGTFGASVTILNVPEMLVRTEDRPEGTGEMFDAGDMAIALSYGRTITDRFSIGATGKFIQQRIWHSSANAFAVDIGTQFRTDFFGGMIIGASIYNFGTDMRMGGRNMRTFVDPDPRSEGNNSRVPANYETSSWSLPLNFQIGVTARPIDTRMHQMLVSVDATHPSANYESINVGGEYGFQNRVFFRGGYNALFLAEAEGGLAAGFGVNQPLPYEGGAVKLDYAFRAAGRLGGVHIVGFGVTF